MARPISADERTLLGSPHFVPKVRLQLENQAGAWQDMGTFMGRDYFVSATWREGIDTNIASGTVVVSRSVRGESISPTIEAAAANHPGGGPDFNPFIRGRQKIRLLEATLAPGDVATDADYQEIFLGRVDDPEWGGTANLITLAIADQGAWLMSQQIDTLRTYSDDVGQPLETVMQAILDDNPVPALAGLVLHVPVSPGINIKKYQQDRVPVFTALITLAQQFGLDIRFRYDPADGVSKLTLSEPDRDNDLSSPDWVFGADEYLALPTLNLNTDDIRTRGRVYYNDAATGEREFQEYTNAVAQLEFGDIYFEIGETATSNIDSAPEALSMVTAAVKDLSAPKMTQRMETMFLWPAQLGDIAQFLPNGQHYDEPQTLAVAGLEHTLTRDTRRTAIDVRGNPAGAYARWLALGASSSNLPDDATTPVLTLHDWREIRRTERDITFGFTPAAGTDRIIVYDFYRAVNDPVAWPPLTAAPSYHLAGDATEITLAYPPNDQVHYVQLAPVTAQNVLGEMIRQRVFANVTPPAIKNEAQQASVSGLFTAVSFDVVDYQTLGGTLKAWTASGTTDSATPTATPDGTLIVAATPAHVDGGTIFTRPDSSTAAILSNVPVHPGRGKRVFFEFTNTLGVSSGVISVNLLSRGGIIDETGRLVDGAIVAATQFAAGITPVQVLAALPSSAPDGTVVFLTTDGQLYRRAAGAWTLEIKAVNLSGQVVASQIAAAAITVAKFAAGLRPVRIVADLTAPGDLEGDTVYLTTDDKLYRWTGAAWTAAVATTDLAGTIASGQIADAAITAAKIGSGAVQTANIAGAAITNALLAANAVQTANVAVNAITSALIAANAVTSTQIADGSISTPKLVANAVTTNELAAGAVTAAKIVAGTITTTQIAAGTITGTNIAAGTIAAGNIVSGTITTAQIAAGTITASNIAANTITGGQIAATTITATNIAGGTITATQLAANSVTATQIAANAVIAGKINAAAVSTTELAANAVTAAKIAAGTITANEIAANTITAGQIAAATITATQIAAGTITATNMAANSIIAGKIAAGAINSSSLFVSGVVTATVISISSLQAITQDLGIIVAGRLNNASGQSYIDVNATGASPFIHVADASAVTTLEILANGSATFYGTVASNIFTAAVANFGGQVNVTGALNIYQASGGGNGIINFYDAGSSLAGTIAMTMTGFPLSTADLNITLALGSLKVDSGGGIEVRNSTIAPGVAPMKMFITSVNDDIGFTVVHRSSAGVYNQKTVSLAASVGGFRALRVVG